MYKATSRKQTPNTFKLCLEALEERCLLDAAPTSLPDLIQQKVSQIQSPLTHMVIDIPVIAIGLGLMRFGLTPTMVGAGMVITAGGSSDFVTSAVKIGSELLSNGVTSVGQTGGNSGLASSSPGLIVNQSAPKQPLSYANPGGALELTGESISQEAETMGNTIVQVTESMPNPMGQMARPVGNAIAQDIDEIGQDVQGVFDAASEDWTVGSYNPQVIRPLSLLIEDLVGELKANYSTALPDDLVTIPGDSALDRNFFGLLNNATLSQNFLGLPNNAALDQNFFGSLNNAAQQQANEWSTAITGVDGLLSDSLNPFFPNNNSGSDFSGTNGSTGSFLGLVVDQNAPKTPL